MWSGPDTKTEFCVWLFSDINQDTVVISHNGKAYDNIFCLEYLLKTKGLLPEVIFTGNKVMSIELPAMGFKIIDSINFLAMPLADFPRTFDLKDENETQSHYRKGYFPYFFNEPDNQDYKGSLPPKEKYGYKRMKPEV